MHKHKFVIYCLTFALSLVAVMGLSGKNARAYEINETQIQIGDSTFNTSSQAMVLLEANSGRVIVNHNGEEKLPMASLTKIITAIVALENCQDLDELHQITAQEQGIEGSSIYLKAGEHLSIRQLLYGLMLRSGNDSAMAIATIVGGSVENFIQLCNDFCQKVGATSTHLENPHGLHSDSHYTTAHDLAVITAYALKNDTFADVVSTKKINIPNELGKYDHRELINKNRFLNMFEGATGVKTGYTKKAGRCFVGSSIRQEDGLQLVCVILNCVPMFQECKAVMELAWQNYTMHNLIDENGYQASINIKNSSQMTDVAQSKNAFSYPLTKEEEDKIEITDTLQKTYDAPIEQGEILGEVKIFLDKQLIFCDNIYSINNIEDDSYNGNLAKIIENF